MMHSNKIRTGTAAILITAIMASFIIASIIASPTAASTATGNTTSTSSSLGIELSSQPIYQKRVQESNITAMNETHASFTFSGNGILSPSNTTQTINTTSNGSGLISLMTPSGYASETIMTEDGNETATVTFYEIVQLNTTAPGRGKGIVTAVFQTNSTGVLSPLNGTIAVGIDDIASSAGSNITLWRWESGVSNNNSTDVMGSSSSPRSVQGDFPVNTTTMTNPNASDRVTEYGVWPWELLFLISFGIG